MGNETAGKWEALAADLELVGDDVVDRIAAVALANPDGEAAPFLIRALDVAASESSKRAAAAALAVAAGPDDSGAVEAVEAAYRSARHDASLGPALLKLLGVYGLRCPTARTAAVSAVQRLKLTDNPYLLTAGAKVAALLLGQRDEPALRQKLDGLIGSDQPDVQAEAHFQLAFLSLFEAFRAPTHGELLARLKRANDGFRTAIDLSELRPDASLAGLLVSLVLKFDVIEHDRRAAAEDIAVLAKRLRAEVGGAGERLFKGYKSPAAVQFAEKALGIARAIEDTADEMVDVDQWTNFDESVVRLADCVILLGTRPEATLGAGRIYEGLSRITDRVVMPRLGPVLMRKVGRQSLAKVVANYRELNGEDEVLAGLTALQEAEREADQNPGARLSEEKQGKLAALAAKVNLSPDKLVDEMIVVVGEDQGLGWAVKVGLLPQSRPVGVQGAGMSQADVVLVTVNDNETDAVFAEFEAATGAKAAPVARDGRLYHNLGTIKGATVYHALSEMGSGGVGGMQQTVDKAIRALDPGAVIAIGIAFGVNEKKQSIGDILLSKQLRPYDLQRLGEEIKLRDDKPSSSAWLLNHFKAFNRSGWEGAKVRDGVILSGNKLIDNVDYRDQLLRLETEAIGGEMEGSGLYVSSHDHKVDWIVVKAICDWADGNKKKNKDARQRKAAQNAAQFVRKAIEYAPLISPTREGRGGPPTVSEAAPKLEKIQLSAALESVNVKSVDPDVNVNGARAELRARFRVANNSNTTARVWNVRIEIVPSSPQMEPYFLEMQNEDSAEPILPRGSKVKSVEFAFRIMNSPVPLPFAFRSLMVTEIRFRTVSEDGEGAPQSVHISQVPDADQLLPTLQTHLANKLGWRT